MTIWQEIERKAMEMARARRQETVRRETAFREAVLSHNEVMRTDIEESMKTLRANIFSGKDKGLALVLTGFQDYEDIPELRLSKQTLHQMSMDISQAIGVDEVHWKLEGPAGSVVAMMRYDQSVDRFYPNLSVSTSVKLRDRNSDDIIVHQVISEPCMLFEQTDPTIHYHRGFIEQSVASAWQIFLQRSITQASASRGLDLLEKNSNPSPQGVGAIMKRHMMDNADNTFANEIRRRKNNYYFPIMQRIHSALENTMWKPTSPVHFPEPLTNMEWKISLKDGLELNIIFSGHPDEPGGVAANITLENINRVVIAAGETYMTTFTRDSYVESVITLLAEVEAMKESPIIPAMR